jgi:hypothetical protein
LLEIRDQGGCVWNTEAGGKVITRESRVLARVDGAEVVIATEHILEIVRVRVETGGDESSRSSAALVGKGHEASYNGCSGRSTAKDLPTAGPVDRRAKGRVSARRQIWHLTGSGL